MNRQYFIFDQGSDRHKFKNFIDPLKDGVWIVDAVVELKETFICETEHFVDFFIFVIPSDQEYLIVVFKFQSE